LCNPITLAWRQAVEDISFHGKTNWVSLKTASPVNVHKWLQSEKSSGLNFKCEVNDRAYAFGFGCFVSSGYVVPKGWKVVCALREVHHDPAYYENPEQFNPWRHDNVYNTSASQYNCTYDYSCRTSLMKCIWKEIQDVG